MTLADYVTLRDGSVRLDGTPNALRLYFDLPADFVKGTKSAKPILQFKLYVRQPSVLQIWINQSTQSTNVELNASLSEHRHYISYHELINGNLFKPGEQNEIKFILMGASTTDTNNDDVSIADVFLLYQRRISI